MISRVWEVFIAVGVIKGKYDLKASCNKCLWILNDIEAEK